MKRLILLTTALLVGGVLLLGARPSAQAAAWAEPYLQNLVTRDIMKGDKDGSLNADRLITRAEFATMVNRAFGFTEKSNKSFSDVKATSWYATDISIAANQGYMEGNGKGANPKGNLTREEAVAMLCRALNIPEASQNELQLDDAKNFSNWSRGYINAALDREFISGYPDSTFRPKNYITRGEAAKMLSEVGGEIVNGTNNNAHGTIYGNVTIASSGVTVSNATIMGDLYLTEGVGLGYVQLKDVTVNGEMIISGAGESNVGESSVTLSDCTVTELTVDVAKRKILTLKTDRSTTVRNAIIKSSTYLEELTDNYEGFDRVTVNGPAGTFLNLTGNFGDIRIMSADAQLGLYKGQTNGITVDETAKNAKIFLEKDTITEAIYFDTGATVTGTGRIKNVLVNNDGVTIDQLPENIYIRPGVKAKINGKNMGSLDAEMDAMEPEFMAGYPMADKILPVSFTEYYKTNKPGKVYYAIYAADMPAPSKDDLMAKNNPPKNALKSGNLSSLPDKEVSVSLAGLKAGTKYVVYSLFVDLRDKSSDVERTNVETVDNVVPSLLSGYPKVGETRKDGASIDLLPNKDTHYYWALMPDKAVAPTVEQLYTQKLSGELAKGIDKGGKLNTLNSIQVSGLDEFKTYTFYVILRDTAENMSKTVYKASFVTKDATSPKFDPGDIYPKTGIVTDSAIPIEYMVSEACTVYWSAAKEGTDVLPKLQGGNLDYTSEKAKGIVKGGTNASKFGKATAAKEKTKYTFSISGLDKQMPYDLYFVLEDKSGNASDVMMVKAKTKDSAAPTVAVTSEQLVGENFSVEAPIILTFSEIVCGSELKADGDYVKLSDIFAKNPEEMKHYIKLVDRTKVPNVEQTIDWSKVTTKEIGAQTIFSFPPAAFSGGGLSNNNNYRFDLSKNANYYIRDTSKNQMKAGTELFFTTVPPLTYFSEVQNFDATKFDAAFYINPQAQNTGENIYFDILLRSDHYIEFELYQGTDITDSTKMTLVKKGGKKTHILDEAQATRFSDYFDTMTKYQAVKNTYYAIKLTKVDTTDIIEGQTPITATINLKLNAVIGSDPSMRPLVGPADDFDKRLKAAKSDNSISSVTAPKDPFEMDISLVDNVPPALESVSFPEEGDRQVLMNIKATKGCTVYYYAVPKGTASEITDPRTLPGMKSNPKQGTVAGSFVIEEDMAIPTQYTIEALLPPDAGQTKREYVLFFALKKASAYSRVYNEVDGGKFNTTPVKPPKIVKDLASLGGDNQVKVTGSWDSKCKMYYLVVPNTNDEPSIEQIMGKESTPNLVLAGSIDVDAGKEFSLDINKINYKYFYNLYAVAQKYIGTAPAGDPSERALLPSFTSRDNEKPFVLVAPEGTINETSADNLRYSGTVLVQFNEGLYYFKQGTSKTTALTADNLMSQLGGNWGEANKIKILRTAEAGEDGAVQQIAFEFSLITDRTTITLNPDIGDKIGNRSGQFKMTFHAPKDSKSEPYWEASFKL